VRSRESSFEISMTVTEHTATRIYLIRHGETAWNAEQRCQGTVDTALSECGLAQARALADVLRDVDFAAAYMSPLERARHTAELVLGERQVTRTVVPELMELSYGVFQGLTPGEWPDGAWDKWNCDPWATSFPQGESLAAVKLRAVPVFERILKRHRGEAVLVSAHGHVNRVLLIHACRFSPSAFWDIAQPNAGGWILEFGEGDPNRATAVEIRIEPFSKTELQEDSTC
jgi:broad specificity phosphatase PhoE